MKEKTKPLHLCKLEALLRRLPRNYPGRQNIEKEYRRLLAGFKGEQSVEYPLSFLREDSYFIFHDLRLPIENNYFQIDTLILTQHYALILEVKNISGTIIFDSHFNQLIRIIDGKEQGFLDPIMQAHRQRMHFTKLLKGYGVTNLPVDYLVVISNPQTIIKSKGDQLTSIKVAHSANLLMKIQELDQSYSKVILNKKRLITLGTQLLKEHYPLNQDILLKYNIPYTHLIKGVLCEACSYIPMNRVKSKWECPQCLYKSKHEYIKALEDYALLVNPSIKVGGAMDFLLLTSRSAMYRLLKKMNLSHNGETKGRVYTLKENEML